MKMSEVKVMFYLGDANVYLNLNAELLGNCTEENVFFTEENLKDSVCKLFPHLDTNDVYVELSGDKYEG